MLVGKGEYMGRIHRMKSHTANRRPVSQQVWHDEDPSMQKALMISIDVVRRGGVECTSRHAQTFSKRIQTSHLYTYVALPTYDFDD